MILACSGWIMEMILQVVQRHKIVNRGFLIGPYCPIYGFGGLFITLFLTQFKEHPILLFFMAVMVCGILEYLTSYFMEKIFHARWWDYSKKKFNLHGRICLGTVIPFGIMGIIVIYLVNPFVFAILSNVPENVLNMIAATLATLLLIDSIVSYRIISNVKKTTVKFNQEGVKDNTEEISTKVRETLRNQSFLNRRLVDAFPNLTAILKEQGEKIKRKTAEVKEEVANRASEVKEDISNRASEMKEGFVSKASEVKKEISKKIDKK